MSKNTNIGNVDLSNNEDAQKIRDINTKVEAGGHIIGGDMIIQSADQIEPPKPDLIADYLDGLLRQHEAQRNKWSEIETHVYECPFMVKPLSGGRSKRLKTVIHQAFEKAWTDDDASAPTMLLLADPGVGKTEALHMLTNTFATEALAGYEALRDQAANENRQIVPIYINLINFLPQSGLEPLIQASINEVSTNKTIDIAQIETLLSTYPCLICIDQLDDLLLRGDWTSIKELRQFMQLHSKTVGYLISCRTRIYHGQLGALQTLILDRLPTETVEQIIRDALRERAQDILSNKAILRAACSRSTLEIILQEKEPLYSRGAAYQNRVRSGLNQTISEPSERDLFERILEEIAYQMHLDNQTVYSEREMMQVINAYMAEWQESRGWRSVLHTLQSTEFLIQNRERQWQFGDRLMQAYFTAAAIIYTPDRLPTIVANSGNHWWQEPLEMLVGLYDNPDELLFQLVDHDPENAAHCIRFVGRPIQPRTFEIIIDSLMYIMREERSAGRLRLVRLFQRMTEAGYPPNKAVLWLLLSEERKSSVIAALTRLLVSLRHYPATDVEKPLPPSENAVSDITRKMEEVIKLWGYYYDEESEPQRQEIEQALIDTLTTRGKEAHRVQGMAAIALGYIGTNGARQKLLQLLHNSRNPFLLWCVVEGLTNIQHDDVFETARHLYRNSKVKRVYALYLLGTSGVVGEPHYRDSLKILEDALEHTVLEARGYAARSITYLRMQHPPLQSLLEAQLRTDVYRPEEQWVQRRYIEALGHIGTPNVIPTLELYLRSIERRTRLRAKQAITEIKRRYELV